MSCFYGMCVCVCVYVSIGTFLQRTVLTLDISRSPPPHTPLSLPPVAHLISLPSSPSLLHTQALPQEIVYDTHFCQSFEPPLFVMVIILVVVFVVRLTQIPRSSSLSLRRLSFNFFYYYFVFQLATRMLMTLLNPPFP